MQTPKTCKTCRFYNNEACDNLYGFYREEHLSSAVSRCIESGFVYSAIEDSLPDKIIEAIKKTDTPLDDLLFDLQASVESVLKTELAGYIEEIDDAIRISKPENFYCSNWQ